ncbi:hypothetical protein B0H17DRAFT_1155301, partial [Mycena rosella]
VFLLGERGDPFQESRPSWAVDGSFLVFRQLQAAVPEFNKFLTTTHSGAPIFLAPTADDPVLGADRTRNNDFNFFVESSESPIPPRDQIQPDAVPVQRSHSQDSPARGPRPIGRYKKLHHRQASRMARKTNINNGFVFLQQSWINNERFPFGKVDKALLRVGVLFGRLLPRPNPIAYGVGFSRAVPSGSHFAPAGVTAQ